MPDHFDQIRSASAKAKQVTAQRILLQDFLNLQRQARESTTQIRVARREPDPNAGGYGDHRDRRPSLSARSAAAKVAPSIAPVTRIRAPFEKSISILPESRSGDGDGSGATGWVGSIVIVAGTNPACGRAASPCAARNARRHSCSCHREMPWRRAVAATWRGERKLSRTTLSFSSSLQRRRRPVSTISRRATFRLCLWTSI